MSTLTRRDVLAAFLGAPLALAACRKRPPPLPPGELRFPTERLGHRVREAVKGSIDVPAEAWSRTGIVIVGGGVAGLSAAWRLARAGIDDFVVLELDRAPGGTAKGGEGSVTSYPWGAHYITAPMPENAALIALLDEAGLVVERDADGGPVFAEENLVRDPEERLFADGRWHEDLYLVDGASPEDLAERDAFRAEVDRWVSFRDARGRRAFALPVAHASDDAEVTALDRISMAEWLDARGLRSERLRWFLEYACRDDYGSTLETTSAWAAIAYFASRLRRPGAAPQAIITFPEGNGRLVAHLHSKVRARVRLGVAVADVAPVMRGDPAKAGVDVKAMREDGSWLGVHADQVIFAAQQFLAPHLIAPYRGAPPAHVASFEYGAWMVANLTLRERPEPPRRRDGPPFAWDSVLRDSPSLGYVNATHQLCRDHGPTVLTYYHPLCDASTLAARRRLLSLGRDEWADVALADLSRAHPDLRDLVTQLDVVRWGHAMVRPKPGFVFGGARARAALPDRGIHFAHTDLSGLPLFEEAFFHGVRAAEEVLVARGLEAPPVR